MADTYTFHGIEVKLVVSPDEHECLGCVFGHPAFARASRSERGDPMCGVKINPWDTLAACVTLAPSDPHHGQQHVFVPVALYEEVATFNAINRLEGDT